MIARKDERKSFTRLKHPVQFRSMPFQIHVLDNVRPIIRQDEFAKVVLAIARDSGKLFGCN